ncbi:thaumatin-like protein 1 isoform X1 [Prunus avium]|uniref:Thaumatin-like protein 1 isoform X1 n=1 Tax=Prunus avium TaxID=42229 RepID=A0A6P5TJT2_PRUAV|nr:thaumatin-like protein 1 isoform X1 [Prunus avium]XP_021827723.1 thaumatin-like protein 1 isoform X1 [Prunus avium]
MMMMKSQAALLGLTTLAILFFSGAHAAKITFTNKCSYTVWPGTLTGDQKPQLSLTGFKLATGISKSVDAPSPWSGRFFGRTRCSTDASGKFTCATADCGSGQVSCNGNGAVPPATLVEITIAPNGGQDFYDVSLVDGFNLPMAACKSACLAFNKPKYCCTPPNDKPKTCPPTNYSRLFKTQCPQAYSYAYDDKSSTFTCNARPDYLITFCP